MLVVGCGGDSTAAVDSHGHPVSQAQVDLAKRQQAMDMQQHVDPRLQARADTIAVDELMRKRAGLPPRGPSAFVDMSDMAHQKAETDQIRQMDMARNRMAHQIYQREMEKRAKAHASSQAH